MNTELLIPRPTERRRGVRIDGQPYIVQAKTIRNAAEKASRDWLREFGFGDIFNPDLTPTDFGGFLLNPPGSEQVVVEVFSS